MTRNALIKKVTDSPRKPSKAFEIGTGLMTLIGLAGLALGFLSGKPATGWTALLTSTVMIVGIGAAGILISAIFHLTNARFGRAYMRIAESFAGFMPVGLILVVVFLTAGGGMLPWAHNEHLTGGKALWLTRGFWDLRVIGALIISFGISLTFLFYSLRRDWAAMPRASRETYSGMARLMAGRNLDDSASESERLRCISRLSILAPLVAISYAVMFSILGFDLIMALDPLWISTLFGAWYFIGNVFVTMALLAVVSIRLRKSLGLDAWITKVHQSDLATLMFAFCLVNADFFWSQYLTIWYGNLPEETGYVMTRTLVTDLPWRPLSWLSLAAFLAFPFILLLFRRVKRSDLLLSLVSIICITGIFLARFIEIAPELLRIAPPAGVNALIVPLLSAILTFIGMLGAGLFLSCRFLKSAPVMPVGDDVFHAVYAVEGDHS